MIKPLIGKVVFGGKVEPDLHLPELDCATCSEKDQRIVDLEAELFYWKSVVETSRSSNGVDVLARENAQLRKDFKSFIDNLKRLIATLEENHDMETEGEI